MVETITPAVHGGRRKPYGITVALHTLAAALAAAALGGLLGGLGALLGAPFGTAGVAALIVVAAFYAAREALGLPLPMLQARRQVPDWWRTFYSPPVAATLYGAVLGVGFTTYLSFGTFMAVAAAAALSGSPILGAVLVAPFGAARGLSVLLSANGEGDGSDTVLRLQKAAATPWPRAVNALALAGVTAAALTAL
jgi:hypothetical protein